RQSDGRRDDLAAQLLALATLRPRRPFQDHVMKKASALAVIDYEDIPAGVYAVDAILKKAPIAFVRAGTVTRGRYLVLFRGTTPTRPRRSRGGERAARRRRAASRTASSPRRTTCSSATSPRRRASTPRRCSSSTGKPGNERPNAECRMQNAE